MPLSPRLRLGSFPIFSLEVGSCCPVLNSIWLHRLYLSFLRTRCDSLLCVFTALCNSSEGTLPPDLQCGIIWLPGFLAQLEVSHWLSALLSWEGEVEILRAKALLLNLSVCLEMKLPWMLAVLLWRDYFSAYLGRVGIFHSQMAAQPFLRKVLSCLRLSRDPCISAP